MVGYTNPFIYLHKRRHRHSLGDSCSNPFDPVHDQCAALPLANTNDWWINPLNRAWGRTGYRGRVQLRSGLLTGNQSVAVQKELGTQDTFLSRIQNRQDKIIHISYNSTTKKYKVRTNIIENVFEVKYSLMINDNPTIVTGYTNIIYGECFINASAPIEFSYNALSLTSNIFSACTEFVFENSSIYLGSCN
jgi:hypothetical protein